MIVEYHSPGRMLVNAMLILVVVVRVCSVFASRLDKGISLSDLLANTLQTRTTTFQYEKGDHPCILNLSL